MLKTCKHSNCAVCKRNKDREIFEAILKKINPDMFFCERAMYKITNSKGGEFILTSLENIRKGKYGYYIVDIFTSRYIYLNKENFEVICTEQGKCDVTPHVTEYITQ